jgi:hypothetical protein
MPWPEAPAAIWTQFEQFGNDIDAKAGHAGRSYISLAHEAVVGQVLADQSLLCLGDVVHLRRFAGVTH